MIKNEEKKGFFHKKKFLIIFISLLVVLGITALVFIPRIAGGGQPNSGNDSGNITDSSTTTTVGEIWTGSIFDKTNFKDLISKITGGGTYNDLVTTLNSGNITAAGIRTNNDGKSVVVTFGGIDWIVTYISKNKSGFPIATLWQASGTETSTWSYGGWMDDGTGALNNPSNIYGTSYIRAYSLNNGGYYTTNTVSGTATEPDYTQKAIKSETNTYAKFTMDNVSGNVVDYLVTPSNVSWQETETHKFAWSYAIPNDAYGTISKGWFKSTTTDLSNYSSKVGYDLWKTDSIWLPSLTETGYSNGAPGLWDLTNDERSNSNTPTWLRSGGYNYSNRSYVLEADGNVTNVNVLGNLRAVRPALHLNLKKAYRSFSKFPIEVPKPNKTSFEYTGSIKTPNITNEPSSTYVTTSGNTSATNAGTYTITYTLKDKTNYEWSDGTTEDKTIEWSITQATNSWTTQPRMQGGIMATSSGLYGHSYSPQGKAKFGTVEFTYATRGSSSYSSTLPSAPGKYTMKATVAETDNWTGLEETVDFEILKDYINIPTPEEISFTYTGFEITPKIKNKPASIFATTTGDTSATNAGSYTITYSLAKPDEIEWSDGTTENKTITWEITKASISKPAVSGETTFTYNKTAQGPTIENGSPDTSLVTITGTVSETNAGSYNRTFALKDKTNYQWSDGTTKDVVISWKINKATITATPSLIKRSFEYTGYEIDVTKGETGVEYGNIKNFDASLMKITPDSVTKRIDVGSFTVKIALKDPNNYQWANGTSNVLRL